MRMPGYASRLRRYAAAIALTGFAAGTHAAAPQDNYWAQLEYFFPDIRSTARLDFPTTDRAGTVINLEDELGLDDRKGTPYLLLGMRLGERWRLEFEYYQLNRNATKDIDRDIQWGDLTFPATGQVSSVFDTSVYRLVGGYSFYRTPQAEAGASIGVHVTDFKLSLAGRGTGPLGLATQSEARDQLVPLPTLGLYGSFLLAERWLLQARVDYLTLNYQDYDGALTNAMASIGWRFARNFGAGIGYRYVDYELNSTKESFHGSVNYRFHGPTLFIDAAF